jgi:thiol-disulfide isomerase/thioredoxin
MSIIELNKINFSGNKLLAPYDGIDKPVIILWKAEWCGYCNAFKDNYKKLAKLFEGKVIFATVDADSNAELINTVNSFLNGYKVLGYPTIVVYRGGYFLETYNQARDVETFSKHLKNIFNLL